MIIKSRRYVIQGKVKLPSQVMVNPTGEITVLIQDQNRRLSASFDDVIFQRKKNTTALKCKNCNSTSKRCKWVLELNHEDAYELKCLMDEAEEELETLMCDL